jgi:hypothetical protein
MEPVDRKKETPGAREAGSAQRQGTKRRKTQETGGEAEGRRRAEEMNRLTRAISVCVCLVGATTCRSETTAAGPSTVLSGTVQAFSAKGDDFSYFLDISLTAVGPDNATVTSVDVTVAAPSSSFVAHSGLSLPQSVTAGATISEPRIVIPNQSGQPYTVGLSVLVKYTDDRGRSGSLILTAAAPSCQAFVFQAACANTHLQVGETSPCSGFVEFGCQPLFEPVASSQIQWQSTAPGIATMTSDFQLIGVSNGSATLTGSYSGVSTAIPVCIGPQCR